MRLAYKEANEWYRTINNYFWLVSSGLIALTAFLIKYVVTCLKNETIPIVFLLGLVVILVLIWVGYLAFLRYTISSFYNFHKKAKYIEKKLGINILADEIEMKKYDKEAKKWVSRLARIILLIPSVNFGTLMAYLAFIVFIICIVLILWIVI